MTDPTLENRRRGFWLRIARERADISQGTAAQELGLSGKSKSTLSAWENGTREPRPSMLSRMAALYGVPVEMFANPAPTAMEVIDQWLDRTVATAGELERLDWGARPAPGPESDASPDGGPRRLTA